MALAAGAGGLAAAAYLNGKYQLWRDFTSVLNVKYIEREYSKRFKQDRLSPWNWLEDCYQRQPNDRAIWTRERSWTYREVRENAIQWAQWMLEQGIQPGDLVTLYLLNSAEYFILICAMFCIGAAPATLNYNVEGRALMHCLSVCNTKLLIVDTDTACLRRINDSRADIESNGTKIVVLDTNIKQGIMSKPINLPDEKYRRRVPGNSPFVVLFTSGTTGLPKGCPFNVDRLHMHGGYLKPQFGTVRGKDCWYCSMPLYHGTGLIGMCAAMLGGVGVAIAPRFSVSKFWTDVHESGSTGVVYVGETARYLLAAPPHALERAHNVRLAWGNGMRPDVWKKFQERFNIPEIAEFFSSSEGVFSLLVWSKNDFLRGYVGHHGLIFRRMLKDVFIPVAIDHDTGDIWRDPETGFAQRMPYEEGGEMIVAVPSKAAFGGYWRNEEATNKRFATDVFRKDDLYYRSGDALKRDPDGRWSFMDRLGDTYRWKSENVSTAEVQEALGHYPGINEANVFGVTVPGHEGRAGCAALDIEGSQRLDYADLLRYTRSQLPNYAVPLFLRVVKRSSHIHNHKQNKVGLRKEGVDPDKLGTEEKDGAEDVFLWWKPGTEEYVPFERKDWEKLVRREVRL